MGLADFFLGEKCRYCGVRSVKSITTFHSDWGVYYCNSCHRFIIRGRVPRCGRCGGTMTTAGQNRYGVYVPKCPNCGHIYD